MKEAIHYAFRTINNILIIEFLSLEDDEVRDYIVGDTKSLSQTIPGNGDHELSQSVLQLADKSWAPIASLYDLASQIRKYSPENKINWIETFMHIEIIKLGGKYVEEKFKPSNDPRFLIIPGYTHISDVSIKAEMLIDYTQNIDIGMVDQMRSKVTKQLEDKEIL